MIVDVKRVLANSLMELAEETPIEKITIQNIVKNCNSGRQTFYNHFRDKNDLINWIYEHSFEETIHEWDTNSNILDCHCAVFKIFLKNKGFFIKTVKLSGQNSFPEFLFEITRDFYLDYITHKFGKEHLTKELRHAIDFNCYGDVSMCINWIKNGMKESPEYMAQQNINNFPLILKKYLIEA